MSQDCLMPGIRSEEELRPHMGEQGVLREGALEAPDRSRCFTVFAQRNDARIELAAWTDHASRYFRARLRVEPEKHYTFDAPRIDAAFVTVAPEHGLEAGRLCFGRPSERDDLRAAEEVDAAAGWTGLALLAKRCGAVWLVDAEGDEDRTSLLLAAILASVVLGPILGPGQRELFGVRTARLKLEGARPPYR